ncbi:hypothetical protein ACFV3T_21995, partial [Streptomyces albidoflavus]
MTKRPAARQPDRPRGRDRPKATKPAFRARPLPESARPVRERPAMAPTRPTLPLPAALRERGRGALLGLAVGAPRGAPPQNHKPTEIR